MQKVGLNAASATIHSSTFLAPTKDRPEQLMQEQLGSPEAGQLMEAVDFGVRA